MVKLARLLFGKASASLCLIKSSKGVEKSDENGLHGTQACVDQTAEQALRLVVCHVEVMLVEELLVLVVI